MVWERRKKLHLRRKVGGGGMASLAPQLRGPCRKQYYMYISIQLMNTKNETRTL